MSPSDEPRTAQPSNAGPRHAQPPDASPGQAVHRDLLPADSNRRRRKLRFVPLIVGVGVASLVSYFYAPKDVDLLLVLPASAVFSNATPSSSVEVRVLRSSDGVQIARARKSRAGEGRTVVLPVRIPRGDYRLEAWPAGVERPERYEARFSFDGDDAIEVTLEQASNDNAPGTP